MEGCSKILKTIKPQDNLIKLQRVKILFCEIEELLKNHPNGEICVDLSEVTMVGSAFMASMAMLIREFPQFNRQVEFVNVQAQVLEILQRFGLPKALKILN